MIKKSTGNNIIPNSVFKYHLVVVFFCAFLTVAHLLSSFFPKARVWGIDHLAYFPLWVRVVFTVLGLLILLPWLNSKVYKLFDRFLSLLQRIFTKRGILGYFLLSLFSMLLFWLMRTKTHFLGDGYLVIHELNSEKYINISIEPLEIFVHLYVYRFLNFFFTLSAESLYVGLSILSGGVFIFILCFLLRALSKERVDRLTIFSLFIFSGSTQLFLGYAEHYTLVYVSVFAYLYFSLRFMQGKAKIFLPILFGVLSITFHFSAAYLLPSLFYLFALRGRKGEMFFSLKRALPYIFVLVLIFALSVYYFWSMHNFLLEIFVPFLQERVDAPGYTLFSVSHLLDMINQLLLISPAGLILVVALILSYPRVIRFKDPIIIFLIVVTLGQFSYHFLVDPKFGAVRDWDLFSSVALGFSLLGIYMFTTLTGLKRYSAMVLIFTAFISTLPWFTLNANTERGITRLKDFVDIDVKRGFSARYALFTYYNQQDKPVEAKRIQAEIFKAFPEDSLHRRAKAYIEQNKLDTATQILKKVIEINPRFQPAYNDLGRIYLLQGKNEEAINLFESILQTNPFNPKVRANLGYGLLYKGSLKEALKEFRTALRLGNRDINIYGNIAYIYFQLGEIEKTINTYRKALEIDPGYYYAHFELGRIYLWRKSLEKALNEFDQSVKIKSDFAPAYYQMGLIYSQKGLRDKAIEQFERFLQFSRDEAQNEKIRKLIQKLSSQNS